MTQEISLRPRHLAPRPSVWFRFGTILLTLTVLAGWPTSANAAGHAVPWISRFDSGRNDSARRVAVSPDGSRVFVAGNSAGSDGLDDYLAIAYNPATGGRIWTARFGGGGSDRLADIGVSSNGKTIFVTGSANTYRKMLTVAFDASSGDVRWVSRLMVESGHVAFGPRRRAER